MGDEIAQFFEGAFASIFLNGGDESDDGEGEEYGDGIGGVVEEDEGEEGGEEEHEDEGFFELGVEGVEEGEGYPMRRVCCRRDLSFVLLVVLVVSSW